MFSNVDNQGEDTSSYEHNKSLPCDVLDSTLLCYDYILVVREFEENSSTSILQGQEKTTTPTTFLFEEWSTEFFSEIDLKRRSVSRCS
ncbi:hypothetical protein H5410_015055 [Solanum commersonii]|uniref:Uncharacterized protein n=1 Tax=Solanum commersonii TaxID=4109 RepID=A0A9J5ZTB2_SOLCO|nr:hypothetical protein H5410_015055 [Solanum commersonii]